MRATSYSSPSAKGVQVETFLQPSEMRLVLITGGDLRLMEETAVVVYRAGHIPMLCEWFASPLESIGGQSGSYETAFTELVHPIAERLLNRCDSVLRLKGSSASADLLVALARSRGVRVYSTLQEALAG